MKPAIQLLIYGQAGIGKTTFAKLSNKPFFLDLENGTIGIPKEQKLTFPLIGFNEASKASMKRLHQFLDEKLKSDKDVGFKTLVIDSLTRIDEYMEKAVIEHARYIGNSKIETIGDFPYGAGYALVKDRVMNIVNKCIALSIQKGIDLVMIAHAKDKQVKKQGQEPYDMVQPRLSKGAMATMVELVPFCFYLGRDVLKDKKGVVTNLYTTADTFCEHVKSRVPLKSKIYNMTATNEEQIKNKVLPFWDELYTSWQEINV